MNAFVLNLDATTISDETEHKSFVQWTVSAVLPDPESEPGLSELVKLYKIHCIQGHAGNILKKINPSFHMGVSFQIGL